MHTHDSDDTLLVATDTAVVSKTPSPGQFDSFDQFVKVVEHHSHQQLTLRGGVAFESQLEPGVLFYQHFLDNLPEERRQEFTCSCCRQFLDNYGGLLTVDPTTGDQYSVLWTIPEEELDPLFIPAVKAMREAVETSKIKRLFVRAGMQEAPRYGFAEKGGFTHFNLTLMAAKQRKNWAKTPNQVMADSLEQFRLLSMALGKIGDLPVKLALKLFETDPQLSCYPNHLDTLRWFADLREKVRKNPKGRRLAWYEVATQAEGRLRIGNTVVGELLSALGEDASPSGIERAKKAFLKMVDPRDYMRPKAAPTEGNVQQAEKIVADLGIASALKRRHLKFEELPAEALSWAPRPIEAPATEGVFGHLTTKDAKPVQARAEMDGGVITWTRFEQEILPNAQELFFRANQLNRVLPFVSLITAVDPEAKPIIRWDREEQRNPVNGVLPMFSQSAIGTPIQHWGLAPYERIPVTAVVRHPSHWHDHAADQAGWRALVLAGAKPKAGGGLGLFAADLRPELHTVRATIEAYSNRGQLEGVDEGFGGLLVSRKMPAINYELYVDDGSFITKYLIDRGE